MPQYSNYIVRKSSISTFEKVATVLLLIFIFAALVVPINQASYSRKLQIEQNAVNKELVEIKEQQNIVKSALAESSLPILNLEAASAGGLSLVKIPFEQINIVVVGE
ncbi:MAG: hypothetical protein WDA17_00680 [Sphaerochaetaceae bacterium]|jgi:hypothetical protein